MARFTAKQMMQPRKKGQPAAPAPATPKVTVRVPPGGEASMRRINNGMVVTTRDANWNRGDEVFVADPSQLNLE